MNARLPGKMTRSRLAWPGLRRMLVIGIAAASVINTPNFAASGAMTSDVLVLQRMVAEMPGVRIGVLDLQRLLAASTDTGIPEPEPEGETGPCATLPQLTRTLDWTPLQAGPVTFLRVLYADDVRESSVPEAAPRVTRVRERYLFRLTANAPPGGDGCAKVLQLDTV
jgi:hypothetical protein